VDDADLLGQIAGSSGPLALAAFDAGVIAGGTPGRPVSEYAAAKVRLIALRASSVIRLISRRR